MPTPLRRSGSGLLQNPRPGLLPCSTSLRLRLSTVTGDFTTGLLWRLARTGLSPAGRQPLLGGTRVAQTRPSGLLDQHPQPDPPPPYPARTSPSRADLASLSEGSGPGHPSL